MIQKMLSYETLRQSLIDTYKLQDDQWISIKQKYGVLRATFIKDGRYMTAVYRKGWYIQ